MLELIIIGLNHKTASIEVRERLAFQESEMENALSQAHSLPSLKESMILSTCNRVEIYAISQQAGKGILDLKDFLSRFHNLPLTNFEKSLYFLVGEGAVRHIFRVACQWKSLGYAEEPGFARACDEYEEFAGILRRHAPDVRFLPADPRSGLDSIYVRDAACVTARGLVLCRMGKALRRGEPDAVREFCDRSGWAVAGEIREPGPLEGGDVVWLDGKTGAVGHGYRTNAEGIRQFRDLVAPDRCEVIEVPLPHWDGPGDVLHLMSMLSPVDDGKLLVYSRLIAVPFRQRLLDMGFTLLEVPDEEYPTMATNVLAWPPGSAWPSPVIPGPPGSSRRLASRS